MSFGRTFLEPRVQPDKIDKRKVHLRSLCLIARGYRWLGGYRKRGGSGREGEEDNGGEGREHAAGFQGLEPSLTLSDFFLLS